MSVADAAVLRYRGRAVTSADIAFVRALIAAHPRASRRRLSKLLCEAWDWRQKNGCLREMLCRGLMLALERAGHIELPPVRQRPLNPLGSKRGARRAAQADLLLERSALRAALSELRPLEFRLTRRSGEEPLLRALIAEHHYLGYAHPVGEHLEYLVYAHGPRGGGRPVAALVWASAARRLAPRDRFIGWSSEARERNVHLIAYNARFLILPWVAVPHLASHLLSRMARRISEDWERAYGHPIHYLETFVEPARFRGTAYRAANWRALGLTTGRGKCDQSGRANRPLKEVLGYPLGRRFRERLGEIEGR